MLLRPGKWLTKATLESLEAPGMPPEGSPTV